MIYHPIGHAVSQEPIDLTHEQKRRPRDRVYRGARNVRREQHVVHLQQRIVRSERLAVVHIQRRACYAALLQRLDQRLLIDQTAARGVDKVRRFFMREKYCMPIMCSVSGVSRRCSDTISPCSNRVSSESTSLIAPRPAFSSFSGLVYASYAITGTPSASRRRASAADVADTGQRYRMTGKRHQMVRVVKLFIHTPSRILRCESAISRVRSSIMPRAKSATGSALRITLSTGILRSLAAAKVNVLHAAAAGQDDLEIRRFLNQRTRHRIEMHEQNLCFADHLVRPSAYGTASGPFRSSLSCREVNSCLSDRPTSAW